MVLGSPRPRKDKPASNRIATPIVKVADTIRGGAALGRITVQMMRRFFAPMARAAVTYSSSLIFMTSARVRRAVCGQLTTPMAMAMVNSVGENRVTSTMANSSVGRT